MGTVLPWIFDEQYDGVSFNQYMGKIAPRSELMGTLLWNDERKYRDPRSPDYHLVHTSWTAYPYVDISTRL